MARFDFCGGSYTAQAVNADCQRCVNLYPEVNESGDGRSKMVLNPTPGIAKIAAFGGSPRGQLEYNGRLFVVADTQLYEITQTIGGTGMPIVVSTAVRGTNLANDGLPASMAASQTQLLIASGGSVYLLILATNAFSQVAATNFTLATGPAPVKQVAFCDSFFLALIANSGTVCISNVFDASSWNLNGQIVVSVFPENIVGMKVDHRQLWLRGNKKTVVYYASGSINVFDVVPGGFIEQGGAAAFACDSVDNSIFWIGQDDKGDRVAWRATGYNASRISTHATELAWQKYPKASDAVSYAYQRFGHSFWVVLYPSANNGNGATWVYDVATNLWHERDFLNETSGASMGHPSWNHSFWNGTHIVGDWRSSNLYQMDDSFLTNAGVPIVRVRRAPHISTELEVMKHTRFELDMETGLGPEPPLQTGGGTPTVLTLQDSSAGLWALTVKDTGLLQTAQIQASNTLATDTFTRANENPLNPANWSILVGSGLQIVSNTCRSATTSLSGELYTGVVFPSDQFCQVQAASVNNADVYSILLILRGTDTSNYSMAVVGVPGTQTVSIFKNVAGVNNTLAGPVAITVANGDVFKFTAVGTQLTGYRNGVQVCSAVDGSIVSGKPGLSIFSNPATDVQLTNFSAGGATGAGPAIFLNIGASTWQLGVTTAGLLTTTNVAFSASNPTIITMVAPGSAWDLSVTSAGLLQTSQNFTTFARGPLVWLRFSDDGGHTWSNAQPRDAGQAGQYKVRVRWARLGRARIRTYEISCSDPIAFRIVDAYVNSQPGYAPSERLTRQYQKVA